MLSDIQTSFWLNERKRRERVEGNAGIKGCGDMLAWHRVKALAASLKTLITKTLQNETSDSVN